MTLIFLLAIAGILFALFGPTGLVVFAIAWVVIGIWASAEHRAWSEQQRRNLKL